MCLELALSRARSLADTLFFHFSDRTRKETGSHTLRRVRRLLDARVTLVIPGEPTTTADPCEAAFDDPSFRQDDEAVLVAAAHDLQLPLPVRATTVSILRP